MISRVSNENDVSMRSGGESAPSGVVVVAATFALAAPASNTTLPSSEVGAVLALVVVSEKSVPDDDLALLNDDAFDPKPRRYWDSAEDPSAFAGRETAS